MTLYRYCIKKILYTIPILFGVTLLTFILFHWVGGDSAFNVGKNGSVEDIENLRIQLGLNQPLYTQYFLFLKQSLTFDWGQSWSTQQNINTMLKDGLGPSLSLTVPAFIISFFLCLIIALISSFYQGQWLDKTLIILSLALMSISFLIYIICFQYFFAFKLGLFPIAGWDSSLDGRWPYLMLPWIISIIVSLGPNTLIFRSALLDESRQDYVTTARAKGLGSKIIYFRHILKNALIPIISVVVMQLPFLMTGSLLLEAFFGIPGLGGTLIQAIQSADFPVIKAMTVTGSLAYMLFNLFSDLLYAFADPRIKFR